MNQFNKDNRLLDALDISLARSGEFLENAMMVINKLSPNSPANCGVVLASLIASQSSVFVGQYYTSALTLEMEAIKDQLSALEGIKEKLDDVTDSLDFMAAGADDKSFVSSKISGWVASADKVACIYKKLEHKWISQNPAYTKKELEQARKLINWMCNAIYEDMGFKHG